MALDLLSPDQANPFADLIAPGSGNLGITPEPQNPFADLIHPDTQATDAAHANLIGGGTADAPAYQEVRLPDNFGNADAALGLNPQEKFLYQYHLGNLNGKGSVINSDGSTSTIKQTMVGIDGRTFNLPTVWDGALHTPDEAVAHAKQIGIDKFPSYGSEAEARQRYDQMHVFMGQDVANRSRTRFEPVPIGVALSTTDYGPFNDLVATAQPKPITNYAEQFGSFADLVPKAAPITERAAAEAEATQPVYSASESDTYPGVPVISKDVINGILDTAKSVTDYIMPGFIDQATRSPIGEVPPLLQAGADSKTTRVIKSLRNGLNEFVAGNATPAMLSTFALGAVPGLTKPVMAAFLGQIGLSVPAVEDRVRQAWRDTPPWSAERINAVRDLATTVTFGMLLSHGVLKGGGPPLAEPKYAGPEGGEVNAIQEPSLIPSQERGILKNVASKPNILQERPQAESGIQGETLSDAEKTVQRGEVEASDDWLSSFSTNDSEARVNAEEKLSGTSLDATQRQALLDDINSGRSQIRAQVAYGAGPREEVTKGGTRSSLERRQPRQPIGESANLKSLGAFQNPLATTETDALRGTDVTSGQVVEALRALPAMSVNEQTARIARNLQKLLHEASPEIKETIRREIKNHGSFSIGIATSKVLRTGQARENVPSDTGRVEPINPEGTPPGAGPPETAPPEAVPPETSAAPAAPGSISPNDLRPALQTDSGIIEGQKGQEHAQVIKDNPQAVADTANFGEENHGFINVNDPQNFISRAQGQEALGLKEPLSSQTLIELQKASEQPTKGGETVTGVPTTEAPVTPKKAADEIKTEIVAGKRDPAEIKNEIVQRVQGALDKVNEEGGVTYQQNNPNYPEDFSFNDKEGNWLVNASVNEISPGKFEGVWKKSGKINKIKGTSQADVLEQIKALHSEAPGNVTFHIPGDGTFKLARSGQALGELLSRAKRMQTGEVPIKAETRLIRKPAGPAYTEAGSYAQHLYETLGKEAAIADQKAQLDQVSPKSQAAKLIKDTLSEIQKYPDKEEPQGATVASETGVQQGTVAVNTQPLTVIPNGAIKTPKSQRQIITDIAKGLQVPIRFGRLRTSKFAGYFIPKLNLIGSKLADNIPIVAHEAGHKLDREFKMSENKAIASELNVLGDPQTAGSMSSWTKSKTNKYKMGEGVAEFIRYWLTDPTHAEQVAPNTFKVFESLLDENKDMGDTLRQAQSDIHTWRTAPSQARLRSQISIGDNPNKTRYTLKQLTRDLVDDLHILRLAVADAAKGLGRPLEPSKDPYLLARNLRGSYGMAGTFVRDGVVDFNTKEVTMGTSFEDALKPVAGRIGDFRDWIVAKGAQDLMRQGKETGLVKSDVDSVVARFDKDPAFQKALGDLQVWSANLVKYAVDSGLLTPKSGAAMLRAHQIYVPLHRVFEIGAGEAPSVEGAGTGRGLNVGKPGTLKYRSGSTRQIVDPLETWVKNAYAIVTASEKAAINHAVAGLARLPDMGKWVEQVKGPQEKVQVGIDKIREQLIDAGADPDMLPDDLMLSFYRQSSQAPFSENTIRIVDPNGKQQFFRLNRDLFDTFHALDLEDSGHLIRALSKPGQLLRSGVVLEPSFALANVMRDLFSSVVISKRGALPFEAPLRGAAALIGNHKLVAEWAAAGGESAIEINYFDRSKMQTYMKERITKDLTPFERALVVAKHPFYALRKLTAFSEEATRIGEYQIAYNALRKSGMAEGEARRLAAFESRDRQDFAKGGAKTKIPRAMTPFWNAALQGNIKLAQSFRERPTRTILQGIAWVTIPKMIEQAVNWDDKDYWDRPQWERDAFFLIPAGKDETGHTRFIRIPTPFEVGIIFGTIPGRMMQWAKTNRQDAMKNFATSFLQQTVPNPMPQVFQVVYEDFMSGKQGWDVYRGRPIVPDSLADLPPELQFTDQTSTLAKKMGEMTGISPMKIDHIIGQTTGGMGKVLSGQQVPGKRFVTTPLRVSNQTIEDFYQKLGELKADYQRAKAGTKDVTVEELPAFNKAARRMGELRTAARVAEDEQTKAELQEEIYQIARRMMGRESP